MLRKETIEKLISIYKDDEKMLKIIERNLMSFEEYHHAIIEMETWIQVYSGNVSTEVYQEKVSLLDKRRTSEHNSVLDDVNLLNRLAEKNNLPLVYEGIISHERPYRREVANAVLEYVDEIIKNRR